MAAGRSMKSLLNRRRRADEEGEDEDGPALVEDSQSDGSVFSDAEDDEADAASLDGAEQSTAGVGSDSTQAKLGGAANGGQDAAKKVRKAKRKSSRKQRIDSAESSSVRDNTFKTVADTEAMMNGLNINDRSRAQEAIDFQDTQPNASTPADVSTDAAAPIPLTAHIESAAGRPRREHEEYRRKRESDPAFIPNRGNFFMHDTRTSNGRGTPPVRGAWNTRGRGRGSNFGGPLSPGAQTPNAERGAEQPWKHDLHDTINEEPGALAPPRPADTPQDHQDSAQPFHKQGPSGPGQHRPLTFSSTTLVGKVQIRVSLPGMKAPVLFSEVPWKQYTRLPNHRPPLRRDKPVRISLAGHTQRYIFPSAERSFIFIPRQMRPNQQGFGRNGYQRSIGGYGYSSRRTSMYGGSVYANSVAASRRSSFASVARDGTFSPVGSFGAAMPPSRPVVRLPHGSQSHFSIPTTPLGPLSGHQTPTMQVHTYPLPQQPTYQGTPTTTMHQPRPQKAISVTGIESPAAALQPTPAPHEMQPFQNQLPAHLSEQTGFNQPPPPYYSPRQQQFSYPQQPPAAAGLTGIPEQAIHAPAFQPPNGPYGQPPYFNPYPPQQGYYYPPAPSGFPSMQMYVPPPQGYMISPPGPSMQPPPAPPQQPPSQPSESSQRQDAASQPPSGMVAHESNGMVFYLSASEAQQQSQSDTYQPAESFVPSYAMPGLPPPTPAPETTYYYPQMQMPVQQMHDGGSSMYYPAQGQGQ